MNIEAYLCKTKWNMLLTKDPSLARTSHIRYWTKEEEIKLVQLTKVYKNSWKNISSEMNLSSSACRLKWKALVKDDQALSIHEESQNWTREDELKLVEFVKIHGTSWKKISSLLNLSINQCSNRWKKLVKADSSLSKLKVYRR